MNREQIFVIPGNSPIGLRLPLDALPAVAKDKQPQKVERSLFEEVPEPGNFDETISNRYDTVTKHIEPLKPIVPTSDTRETENDSKKKLEEKKKSSENEEPEPVLEFGVPVIKTSLCVALQAV